MAIQRHAPWGLFILFVISAIYFHDGEPLFISQGPFGAGKLIVWSMFAGFLAYSIYCSSKENIFKTVKTIIPFHWARQIGIDLYLGLAISLFIIYLNEGSLLVLALWLLPVVLFANLATLLYFALNYDAIVSLFALQA